MLLVCRIRKFCDNDGQLRASQQPTTNNNPEYPHLPDKSTIHTVSITDRIVDYDIELMAGMQRRPFLFLGLSSLLLCLNLEPSCAFQQGHKPNIMEANIRLFSTAPVRLYKEEAKASDGAWDVQLNQLLSFKNEYGHVNVPQHPLPQVQQKYPHLANFCRNQRNQYKNRLSEETKHLSFLTETRIQRLKSLGFEFDVRQAVWNSKYKELVEFGNEHGHLDVAQKRWPDLHNWINYQRMKYKDPQRYKPLSIHQIELLERLGVRWSPKDEVWWNNYDMLKTYKEQNGDFKTSVSELRRWKNSLRRACREYVLAVTIEGGTDDVHVSGLNQERLQALRKLKFCWLPETQGPLTEGPPDDIFAGYE
jgi:hypothetical protein